MHWLAATCLVSLALATALPPGGRAMLEDAPLSGLTVRAPAELARTEVVAVEGMPFDRAYRVATLAQPETVWGIQLVAGAAGEIRKGDVCLLTCYMRTLESEEESGEGRAVLCVQRNREPWEKPVNVAVSAGREWRRLDLPFRADTSLPDGQAMASVRLGVRPQTVEIGGLSLLNFGDRARLEDLPRTAQSYPGRSADAAWRAEARQRIERIRKGDLTVRVTDAAGNPVEGAKVRVAMTRHAFGFGSAVKARMVCDDSEDGRRYRQVVEANYNKVVFENDLKPRFWGLGRTNEHRLWRREWVDRAIPWLRERGISIRGHYMIWGPLGERAEEYAGRPDDLRRDTFAHVRERVGAVGAHIDEWDAINHISGWGRTFEGFFGGPDFYVDTMKLARELVPDADLWVNEGQVLPNGSRRDDYERLLRYLIDHDAAPDGIGFMAHFGSASLTAPAELVEVFDRFGAIVPRLQLTEFDVNCGDEALQADYLRDVMIAAFSHPQIEAIVMWGFWEGAIWKPDAALYRSDWTLKPAGQAWVDLVRAEWWTNEAGTTDAAGEMTVRGFLGDYEITVTRGGVAAGAAAALTREGATVDIRLE